MNNKGFMMAEVVVVSAIIMVTLVGLYSSYSKIFTLYNQRLNYYDVATLYELAYIRDSNIDSLSTLESGSSITDSVESGDRVYYLNKSSLSISGINKTFEEYLSFLSTSVDFTGINNILVMENCNADGVTNCKYAYLEVF